MVLNHLSPAYLPLEGIIGILGFGPWSNLLAMPVPWVIIGLMLLSSHQSVIT